MTGETKVCRVCGEEKELNEFSKAKSNKDGYNKTCKICINKREKLIREEKNKGKISCSDRLKEMWKDPEYRNKMCKQSSDLWKNEDYRIKVTDIMSTPEYKEKMSEATKGRVRTKESIRKGELNNSNNKSIIIDNITYISIAEASRKIDISQSKIRVRLRSSNFPNYSYLNDSDILPNGNERMREYRKRNKEKLKNKRNENIDEIRKKERENYKNNREKIRKYQRLYIDKNYEKIKKQKYDLHNYKLKNDINFRLKQRISGSIRNIIKRFNFRKKSRTVEILGCSIEEFKLYIESQFEPWMNWENYGNWNGISNDYNQSWDLDHKIPISSATTEDEVIALSHYTNFQPLCSYTNRFIKRNKILV